MNSILCLFCLALFLIVYVSSAEASGAGEIEKRIKDLGLELPECPTPVANYVSVQRSGNLLFFSGAGPFKAGKPVMFGKLGKELNVEQGYEAAQLTALNLISLLKKEVKDLSRVKQVVKLLGFVSSVDDFNQQPAVINGASDLIVKVFGDKGKHARSAVSVNSLPFSIPVEIEMIVEIKG